MNNKAACKLSAIRLKMALSVDSNDAISDIRKIIEEKPGSGFYYRVIIPGVGLIRSITMHIDYEDAFESAVKDIPELLTGNHSIPDRQVCKYAIEYLNSVNYDAESYTNKFEEMQVSIHDKSIK